MSTKKASKKKKQAPPLEFGGYQLVNHDKVHRAINGTIGREGKMEGGVGKEATAAQVLAEYDRLGGLILDQYGTKLETGSFYDFDKGEPRVKATPKKKAEPKAKKGITEKKVGDKVKGKKKTMPDEDEEEGETDLDEDEVDDGDEEEDL